MAIILNSDVIIAGERGTLDLERWLASQPGEEFEVAAITVAKLWHRVERELLRTEQRGRAILRNPSLRCALSPTPNKRRISMPACRRSSNRQVR